MNIEQFKDQLSEEEIAAFEAEDEEAAEEAIAQLSADPEDDEPDEQAAAEEEPVAEAAEAQEDGATEVEDAEDTSKPEASEEEAEDDLREPAPYVDTEALKAEIDEAQAQKDALLEQYDDGDLTREEYQAQLRELDNGIADKRAELNGAEKQAKSEQEAWLDAGMAYLDKFPGLKEPGVVEAFDRAVRYVTSNPTNQRLSFEGLLQRAHAQLEYEAQGSDMVVPTLKAVKKAEEPAPEDTAKAPEGDGTVGGTVQTLAKAPASDVSGVDDSPFASLERLAQGNDPMAFEEAMGKLTPEQRDAFASADIG